ncbi:MAG: hypothetical protein ACK48M_09020 [Planctomycetia bacterium]
MAARVWGFVCLTAFAAVMEAGLSAAASPGDIAALRVRAKLDVSGEIFAPAGGDAEPIRQPIAVAGEFDFLETAAPDVHDGAKAAVIRHYTEAAAEVTVDGQPVRAELAADARTLAVARLGTTPVPFLREAFLTRDEAELLEMPFDSLLLDELLPKSPVSVGEAWQISGDVTAGLLAIDTVETGSIEAKLVEAADGTATVSLAGIIDGAVDGVPTHVVVDGTFTAPVRDEEERHVIDGRVAGVEVVLRERSHASQVAPGFDVAARLDLARTAVPGQAAGSPAQAALATTRRRGEGKPGIVWHRDGEGRYDLVYDARWRTVEDGVNGLVLRLVDHGALVAQCSITALPRAAADITPTIDEVKRDIETSLSGQFARFGEATQDDAGDAESGGRLTLVRVASSGTAEGLPFHWIHYVVSDGEGRRAGVTFMFEASLIKRFGDADRALVQGLRLEPAGVREARLPEKTALP